MTTAANAPAISDDEVALIAETARLIAELRDSQARMLADLATLRSQLFTEETP